MDMDTDDEVLRSLSEGNSMDYEQWPALLSRLITRLEKIVETSFPPRPFLASQPSSSQSSSHPNIPIPSSPPTQNASQSTNPEPSSQNSNSSSEVRDKENAPPTPKPPATTVPPSTQTLLQSITSTLESLFSRYPPHTIQRLAELILYPRQHYKTVNSYLHAVDRVVHVSSSANFFPLPPAVPDVSSAAVLSNGITDPLSVSWGNTVNSISSVAAGLGSDESLGGALLTPIPWLTNSKNVGSLHSGGSRSPMEREVKTESTELIEGPNGPGGIETVTVSVNGISSAREPLVVAGAGANEPDTSATLRAEGGVTQGELLRQEQKAGVVPVAQLTSSRGGTDGLGEEDEVPHARGPDEIGMEDTGPQSTSGSDKSGLNASMQGIDVDAAVGRKEEVTPEDEEMKEPEAPGTPKREAEDEAGGEEKRFKKDIKMTEQGGEVELVDAGEPTEDDKKIGEEGETKRADAVNSSIL